MGSPAGPSSTADGHAYHTNKVTPRSQRKVTAGIPVAPWAGSDPGGLGEDVITAIGDLAQLLNGFIQVAALGDVPHRGASASTAS
jgi:hypothetical protein